MEEEPWQWQGERPLSRLALELVFGWLGGAELARAGLVSRSWRRAVATPWLWRRLLTTLAPLSRAQQLTLHRLRGEVGWRQLYVEAMAGWEPVEILKPSVGLQYAALCPHGERLALLANDATVSIWQRSEQGSGLSEWVECWGSSLRDRGWASAERAEWARGGTRLLVSGTRALLHHDSWELVVLHEEGGWQSGARARASAGAAGCWADSAGEAFLSFELRALAPALAATTVWLNSASQETQSEYAGVTVPLMRIFNEGGHLLRAVVAEVAAGCAPIPVDDGDEYLTAACTDRGSTEIRLLLAGWGRLGAGALGAWALVERRPPPLLATDAGDLRSRLLRHRASRAAPPPPDHEPTEAEVRALCTLPDAVCPLPARPTGFVVHPNGRCVWVCWSGGAGACLALPTLSPLRALACCPSAGSPSSDFDHYAQPDASRVYFAAPSGGMSGTVNVWSAGVCGRRLDGAPQRLARGGPALGALLPPPRRTSPTESSTLLVLTPDALHVWRSRATPQPHVPS